MKHDIIKIIEQLLKDSEQYYAFKSDEQKCWFSRDYPASIKKIDPSMQSADFIISFTDDQEKIKLDIHVRPTSLQNIFRKIRYRPTDLSGVNEAYYDKNDRFFKHYPGDHIDLIKFLDIIFSTHIKTSYKWRGFFMRNRISVLNFIVIKTLRFQFFLIYFLREWFGKSIKHESSKKDYVPGIRYLDDDALKLEVNCDSLDFEGYSINKKALSRYFMLSFIVFLLIYFSNIRLSIFKVISDSTYLTIVFTGVTLVFYAEFVPGIIVKLLKWARNYYMIKIDHGIVIKFNHKKASIKNRF